MLTVPSDLIASVVAWSRADEAAIKRIIRNNKVDFLYLTAVSKNPRDAFERVKRSQGRANNHFPRFPNRNTQVAAMLTQFYGDTESLYVPPSIRPPHLPSWLREEIAAYFDLERPSPHAELSFWILHKLLLDGIFMGALLRMRKRWRIDLTKSAVEWYLMMNQWQQAALERLKEYGVVTDEYGSGPRLRISGSFAPGSHDSIRIDSHGTAGIQFGGMRTGLHSEVPLDERDMSTYGRMARFNGFGLPIQDYDSDIDALTWLAGARPGHPSWKVWSEELLWDGDHLPWSSDFDALDMPHWRSTGRNTKLARVGYRHDERGWLEQFGKTCGVPISEVTKADWPGEGAREPGITFVSRWVNVDDYPSHLRPELVYSIVQTWGLYEPLPGSQNVRNRLKALLRPIRQREVSAPLLDDLSAEDYDKALDTLEAARAAARKRASRMK